MRTNFNVRNRAQGLVLDGTPAQMGRITFYPAGGRIRSLETIRQIPEHCLQIDRQP